jgi:hypothetical protein
MDGFDERAMRAPPRAMVPRKKNVGAWTVALAARIVQERERERERERYLAVNVEIL